MNNVSELNLIESYSSNPLSNLIYIDNAVQHDTFFIIKINYDIYFKSSCDDIQTHLDAFYTFYKNNNYTNKLIIIIDVKEIKNNLQNSNIDNIGIIYNANLIKLISYVNNTYNSYIEKCVLINYTNIDRHVVLLFKQLFKHNSFINKLGFYSKNS